MNIRVCAFTAGLLLAFAAHGAERYPQVSETDFAAWQQLLVVADIAPGEKYEAEICPPTSICLDSAPFWFHAKIASSVDGSDVPSALRVSTRSHYGMAPETQFRGPYLMALRRDSGRYIMPRYAKWPLMRDRSGALYLKMSSTETPLDLPCGIASLREEIFQQNFAEGAAIAREELRRHRLHASNDFFIVDSKGAWPRYGIPVERLRQYLAKTGSDVKLSCLPPGTAD